MPTYLEDGGHLGHRLGKLLNVICYAYSARTLELGHYTLKELQNGVHFLQISILDTLGILSFEGEKLMSLSTKTFQEWCRWDRYLKHTFSKDQPSCTVICSTDFFSSIESKFQDEEYQGLGVFPS